VVVGATGEVTGRRGGVADRVGVAERLARARAPKAPGELAPTVTITTTASPPSERNPRDMSTLRGVDSYGDTFGPRCNVL
jgi:hypothetical protein